MKGYPLNQFGISHMGKNVNPMPLFDQFPCDFNGVKFFAARLTESFDQKCNFNRLQPVVSPHKIKIVAICFHKGGKDLDVAEQSKFLEFVKYLKLC